MSRAYQGYTQANQSLLEEDEDDDSNDSPPHFFSKRGETSALNNDHDSSDDEVPQSLMIEARKPTSKGKHKERAPPLLPIHLSVPPRPSDIDPEEHNTPRAQFNVHDDRPHRHNGGLDPYDKALWKWVNIYNLDAFLQDVYFYYEGKGIYSISLSRGLNLLCVVCVLYCAVLILSRTMGFVIGFSTFLLGCIDYSRIVPDKSLRLSDVVVKHCVARFVARA